MVPAPYDPKSALYNAFPKMKALSKSADHGMNHAECELARREMTGRDTSYARATLDEAEWRISCTSDGSGSRYVDTNPYTGGYRATGNVYNEYTGAGAFSEQSYNPYTGTYRADRTSYNPYTGNVRSSSVTTQR